MITIAVIFFGGEEIVHLPAVPRVGEIINLSRGTEMNFCEVIAVIWEPYGRGPVATLRTKPAE